MDDLFQLEDSPNLCRSPSRLGPLLVRLLSTCTRLKLPETAPLSSRLCSSGHTLRSSPTFMCHWRQFGHLAVWPFGCVEKAMTIVAFSSQWRSLQRALQGCATLAETPSTNVVVKSPAGKGRWSSTTFVVELPAGTQKRQRPQNRSPKW